MGCDWHGYRHVDSNHADLHLALEVACRSAVASEDRDSVSVRVGIDECHRFPEARDPDDAQNRTEDLIVVGPRARGDPVEQGAAEEEPTPRVVNRSVDDDLGSFSGRSLHVGSDSVAVLAGDERTHHRSRIVATPDHHVRDPIRDRFTSGSPTAPTATTTEIAMQGSPAEP
jgi:hypothetical protein